MSDEEMTSVEVSAQPVDQPAEPQAQAEASEPSEESQDVTPGRATRHRGRPKGSSRTKLLKDKRREAEELEREQQAVLEAALSAANLEEPVTDSVDEPVPEKPARPKRTRKSAVKKDAEAPASEEEGAQEPTEDKPVKPARTRRKKVEPEQEALPIAEDVRPQAVEDAATAAFPEFASNAIPSDWQPSADERAAIRDAAIERGAARDHSDVPERLMHEQPSEEGGSRPEAAEKAEPKAEGEGASESKDESGKPRREEQQEGRRRRVRNRDRNDKDQRSDSDKPSGKQRDEKQGGKNGNDRQNRNDKDQRNNKQGRNNNNNQKQRQQKAPTEPSLTKEELEALKVVELREKGEELGLDVKGLKKNELIDQIYDAAARAEGFRQVAGVLDITSDGYGFVRTGNFMPGDNDAFVPQGLIKGMGLRRGDLVEGTARPARPNDKYPAMTKVVAVNGATPEECKRRVRFKDLTPIYPDERLRMETGKDAITGRAIDLVAPVGKGQRGLIVSPPKAGKTTILKRICQSIAANNPEVYLICLLVDERPEEVTDMQRSIKGEVVASTFDMPADNHTAVAELVIERAKRMVELGRDVVVVLDSITRLARAYNLAAPASGRILSGGVDSAALYPPKRFLGAARNIENGGSLTILASALIDTGSKMDEVIFEEFKGTGNMELKLDRDLADKRIFPAIDPVASGTRNEDLLIDAEMAPFVWGLRRVLANMNNVERAEKALVNGLKGTKTNEEFLIRSAKKAAMTDYSDV